MALSQLILISGTGYRLTFSKWMGLTRGLISAARVKCRCNA